MSDDEEQSKELDSARLRAAESIGISINFPNIKKWQPREQKPRLQHLKKAMRARAHALGLGSDPVKSSWTPQMCADWLSQNPQNTSSLKLLRELVRGQRRARKRVRQRTRRHRRQS